MWALWLLISIYYLIIAWAGNDRSTPLVFDPVSLPVRLSSWINPLVEVGTKGAGLVLSILLCQRLNRKFVVLLTLICLFVVWRNWLVEIFFDMYVMPVRVSLAMAMHEWLQRHTRTTMLAISYFPFLVFSVISTFFWPFYALLSIPESNKSDVRPPPIP